MTRLATGRPNRLVPTAAAALTHDAADLLEFAPDGTIVARYQAKLGPAAAMDAVHAPKYSGMTVLTTPENLESIRQKVIREQAKALRRVLPLDPYWQGIATALDEGKLTDRIPDGILAPTRRETSKLVRRWLIGEWRLLRRSFPRTARLMMAAARLGQLAPAFAGAGRAFGKVVVIAGIVGTGYAEYHDIQRFRAGEIGPYYLAFKSGLRATQLSLAYYAATTPEPFTKVAAGVAAGAFVVIDIASDPVYAVIFEKWQAAARALLQSVEREERYHAVRFSLVHES